MHERLVLVSDTQGGWFDAVCVCVGVLVERAMWGPGSEVRTVSLKP